MPKSEDPKMMMTQQSRYTAAAVGWDANYMSVGEMTICRRVPVEIGNSKIVWTHYRTILYYEVQVPGLQTIYDIY